jgi:hypothetical protein
MRKTNSAFDNVYATGSNTIFVVLSKVSCVDSCGFANELFNLPFENILGHPSIPWALQPKSGLGLLL